MTEAILNSLPVLGCLLLAAVAIWQVASLRERVERLEGERKCVRVACMSCGRVRMWTKWPEHLDGDSYACGDCGTRGHYATELTSDAAGLLVDRALR